MGKFTEWHLSDLRVVGIAVEVWDQAALIEQSSRLDRRAQSALAGRFRRHPTQKQGNPRCGLGLDEPPLFDLSAKQVAEIPKILPAIFVGRPVEGVNHYGCPPRVKPLSFLECRCRPMQKLVANGRNA